MLKSLRVRYFGYVAAAGALSLLTACGGLSDRQLTSIWQTSITTALNTVIGNFVALLFSQQS